MRAHLDAFASAGANMVRVVGGLVYEQDEFWEQCAQLGLMVWQDAMQATFDPPAEVSELVVREIAELLESVSGNPALTVVSGGSETLQRPEMLGIEQGEFNTLSCPERWLSILVFLTSGRVLLLPPMGTISRSGPTRVLRIGSGWAAICG